MERRHVTLREALASDQLEAFVRQEEALGVELAKGSDFERALALLDYTTPDTVRLAPKSGHSSARVARPLSDKRRHQTWSRDALFKSATLIVAAAASTIRSPTPWPPPIVSVSPTRYSGLNGRVGRWTRLGGCDDDDSRRPLTIVK